MHKKYSELIYIIILLKSIELIWSDFGSSMHYPVALGKSSLKYIVFA